MEDSRLLRQRADEHRSAARTTPDLWESVIRFSLAERYDELAARREACEPRTMPEIARAG